MKRAIVIIIIIMLSVGMGYVCNFFTQSIIAGILIGIAFGTGLSLIFYIFSSLVAGSKSDDLP